MLDLSPSTDAAGCALVIGVVLPLANTAVVSLTTHASRLQPRDMVEGAHTNLIGTKVTKNIELNLNFDKTQNTASLVPRQKKY